MLALWLTLPVQAPLALGTLLTCIALALYADRALRRRERRASHRRLVELIRTCELFLREQTDARALRRVVGEVGDATFWTALETLSLRWRRADWRRLADALERNPHAAAERRALRDDSPWRRTLAARRLGLLASPQSRRALRRALVRGREPIAFAAARALARFGDRAALSWILAHPNAFIRRPHAALVSLLRSFGSRACPLLTTALEASHDPALERAIVEALGVGRYQPASVAIERRLKARDLELRIAAARALGRLGATDSVDGLVAALDDTEWQVRAQSARALGLLGDARAVDALARRLTDRSWWVRRHAAYALAGRGEEGRAMLQTIERSSPDPYARDMAREALDMRPRRRSA